VVIRCCSSICSGSSAIRKSTFSFIPAFGIISEIVSTFSRKPIFGYLGMVLAMCTIGSARLHRLGASHVHGRPVSADTMAYYMIATMVIAVPTGVKIFSWLGTMWGGSITFETPMLFAIGFIFLFVVGGVTGVVLANAASTLPMQDTYYVVAHFHYVMSPGRGVRVFAAFYYWMAKCRAPL
jgi:cytochrome c oxidase subunit 1